MKTQNINLPSTTGWGEHKFANRANHYILYSRDTIIDTNRFINKNCNFFLLIYEVVTHSV